MIQGLKLRVYVLGFKAGCRVRGAGCGVLDPGFGVWGAGSRVQGTNGRALLRLDCGGALVFAPHIRQVHGHRLAQAKERLQGGKGEGTSGCRVHDFRVKGLGFRV
jgi:hypothetical protein